MRSPTQQSGRLYMEEWLIIGLIVLCQGLLLIIGVAAKADTERWELFKTERNCKVVAQVRGDTFNTVSVGGNGQVHVGVGSTPDKTGWLCDDGITYYR